MGLTLAKCPACGADLNLETDMDYFYCPHCGSKVLQMEDRIVIEHVNRNVDEAEVKRVEFEHERYVGDEERRKELELRNQKRATKSMVVGAVLAVIGFIGQSIAPRSSDLHSALFMLMFIGITAVMMGFFVYLSPDVSNHNPGKREK